MSEEKRKILNMLSDGKISVDDADRLLKAVENGPEKPEHLDHPPGDDIQFLFIAVSPKKDGKDKVDIKIPLKLVKAGIKLASLLPEEAQTHMNEALKEKGIDFDVHSLNRENVDAFINELRDFKIDLETDKESVKIYCG